MERKLNTNYYTKNSNSKECACFANTLIFANLTKDEKEYLDNCRSEVKYKKGETIFKQGTTCKDVFTLSEGIAKAYIEGEDGRNLLIGFLRPFILVAGPGLYTDGHHHYSVSAVTNCTTCLFDANAIKKIIGQNEKFGADFIAAFSYRTIMTFKMMMSLTHKNMEGRMADTLLYLQDFFDKEPIKYISKIELAELTAMSKESAQRVLKSFSDEGLVKFDEKSIYITNPDALLNIAAHG